MQTKTWFWCLPLCVCVFHMCSLIIIIIIINRYSSSFFFKCYYRCLCSSVFFSFPVYLFYIVVKKKTKYHPHCGVKRKKAKKEMKCVFFCTPQWGWVCVWKWDIIIFFLFIYVIFHVLRKTTLLATINVCNDYVLIRIIGTVKLNTTIPELW